jgi:hypothetical protein
MRPDVIVGQLRGIASHRHRPNVRTWLTLVRGRESCVNIETSPSLPAHAHSVSAVEAHFTRSEHGGRHYAEYA